MGPNARLSKTPAGLAEARMRFPKRDRAAVALLRAVDGVKPAILVAQVAGMEWATAMVILDRLEAEGLVRPVLEEARPAQRDDPATLDFTGGG